MLFSSSFEDRRSEAIAILRANDRGGYTVPTDRLYPFQWNWDSAFCAMGFATFDEPRAWDELDSLFQGQWDDGMVPHIVFHQPSDSYFPGPEVWGTAHQPPTSGITQPPVAAMAARWVLDHALDSELAEARCRMLYPKLFAWHRWWTAARDRDGIGLVAIIHPWESGMDNSPAWDRAMARVPATTTPYQRKDTGHVEAGMRPRKDDYDRYVFLLETFRAAHWDPARIWQTTPFKVAHIGINAILQRAEIDLLALARRFGSNLDQNAIEARIAHRNDAIGKLWSNDMNAFRSLDMMTGELIEARTSAGFLPLLCDAPTREQAHRMAGEMSRWRSSASFGLPTVPLDDPLVEPRRYWRGPVWAIINSLLVDGLRRHGEGELADSLMADTQALLGQHGFAEYFDPRDGTPCGGFGFSWTAATALFMGLFDPPTHAPVVRPAA